MKIHSLTIALAVTLTSCSGSSSSPTIDDAQNPKVPETPDTPETPDVPNTQALLQEPVFQGELAFDDEQVVDLDPMIEAAGLSRAWDFVLARNGESIRGNAKDDTGVDKGVITIDVDSATPSWLATNIAADTRLLFDVDNNPIAVYSVDCLDVGYTPHFDNNIIDISSLLPAGRCINDEAQLSADGNVVLLESYEPGSGPDEKLDLTMQAYTLDTALLNSLPDISLMVDGITLSAFETIPFGYEKILSDDGTQLFFKQWWSANDTNGNEVRQVGAVLWNTASSNWQIRGQAADMRGCSITQKVSCNPPYFYAMSGDGSKQYFSYPTTELIDNGNAPIRFKVNIDDADTGSDLGTTVTGVRSVRSLDTNFDGDLLLLEPGQNNEAIEDGYALHQQSSDKLISINRMFQDCPPEGEDGGCLYTSAPSSTTSDGESFTRGGNQLLFRSISRFTDNREQGVDDFLLDVDSAAMYTLPTFYSADPDWVSGDASVLIGNTEFPDHDVLIGKW